jgi:hypothetical protein
MQKRILLKISSFAIGICSLILSNPSLAADTYNFASGVLSIPLVKVGSNYYREVQITIGEIKSVELGAPKAQFDEYDLTKNLLTIPTVKVGDQTYTNVSVTVGQVLCISCPLPYQEVTNITWRQTNNSIALPSEVVGIYRSRIGFGSFDFNGQGRKSFFFPSGAEFVKPRTSADQDFKLFGFDNNNNIILEKNPLAEKYVAGFVTDYLEGNFGAGPRSLIFIDQGRESDLNPLPPMENSYLWRMDFVNGSWQVTEFAKELGRQFWHSANNPIDINGDGVLDFSAANLSAKSQDLRNVVFTSKNGTKDYATLDLTNHLCQDPSDTMKSSGSAALIRLADGGVAAVSLPYAPSLPWSKANQGSIMKLNKSGTSVISTQCIDVRGTELTKGTTELEGYNSIKVADLNGDGLDDFIATGEDRLGGANKLKRIVAFTQNPNGTFVNANASLNLSFTYQLPNVDSLNFSDWVSNEFAITDLNGDGIPDLFLGSRLISPSAMRTNGLRGGLVNKKGTFEHFKIPYEKIKWNNDRQLLSFYYIFPTELNSDGITDFLLVTQDMDEKYVSSSNEYGIFHRISMLLSEKN